MHRVRTRRGVAMVRELWEARDRIAAERDTSPGRVLPDAVLVELALAAPRAPADLPAGHRSIRRYQRQWLDAVRRASALPEAELPSATLRSDGPPPARAWADRDPVAAARLAQAREQLAAFALERQVPVENVISPEPLRRVLWTPPSDRSVAGFTEALLRLDARPWQAEVVAPLLARAVADHPDA
jgi:ribonuclease D